MTHTSAKRSPLMLIGSIALTCLLSACGGGGGGDTTTPTTPTTPVVVTPETDLNTEFGDYLTALTDTHIIPSYSAMQTQAQSLTDVATTFCNLSSQSNDELEQLQQSWRDFNLGWQRIQWLAVGAVTQDNRIFRFQFWPDTQGRVSDGVEDLLVDLAQVTATAELISSEPIQVQGIPALEYLLFPPSSSNSLLSADNKEKRCEVVVAIANNLLNMSTDILTDWQASGGDYRANIINGTGEFDSVQEVVEELVTYWLEHIEVVEDTKINEIVGTESPGNPEDAEHYLSDESLMSIVTNIETILSIYNNGEEKGFDDILQDFIEQPTVNDEITASLTSISSQITQINQDFASYEAALSDTNGRAALSTLVNEMRLLIDLIQVDFVQAFGIALNFTSTDGD